MAGELGRVEEGDEGKLLVVQLVHVIASFAAITQEGRKGGIGKHHAIDITSLMRIVSTILKTAAAGVRDSRKTQGHIWRQHWNFWVTTVDT